MPDVAVVQRPITLLNVHLLVKARLNPIRQGVQALILSAIDDGAGLLSAQEYLSLINSPVAGLC